jgi:CheY-like chemotaxis protein
MGDSQRLQQVAWNVISNAIKFTSKGGSVQVVLKQTQSQLEFSVIDNGKGIHPDFLPYVFERFRQADASAKRAVGGLGLGLAIVKQLVELHGGTVRASSPGEGLGSTFTVALPWISVQTPALEPAERGMDASRRQPQISLQGVTVLVVDDELDVRDLIRRVLDGYSATVITASSVAEAMESFRKHQPHVIVSDIGMPEQDGYEFIRLVRKLRREEGGQTPAAALTAYARTQDRRQALLAGYQTHIVKPADPLELVTVIASLAGKLDASHRSSGPSSERSSSA